VSFASSQVGSEPYVEQRLDSRGVLGGLRKSASAIVLHMGMICTMLEAQGTCCWAREGRYLDASWRKKHREAGWPREELGPPAKSKTSSSSRLNMCADYLTPLRLAARVLEMSRTSQLTLAGTLAGAIGIVFFVHQAQITEKAVRALDVPHDLSTNNFRPCMPVSSVTTSSSG
jgi:hypothetical protein